MESLEEIIKKNENVNGIISISSIMQYRTVVPAHMEMVVLFFP